LRLPAIYQWPEMAEEGGLVGYGPRFVEVFRRQAPVAERPVALPPEERER